MYNQCGSKAPVVFSPPFPSHLQVYRHHFKQLVSHQLPEHYNDALLFLIGGESQCRGCRISATIKSHSFKCHKLHSIPYIERYHTFGFLLKYSRSSVIVIATDNGTVIPGSWTDFCQVLGPQDQPEKCRLGLQFIQESIRLLSSHYLDKRTGTGMYMY